MFNLRTDYFSIPYAKKYPNIKGGGGWKNLRRIRAIDSFSYNTKKSERDVRNIKYKE